MEKLNILIISHVIPYPLSSGQQLRVFYTLIALRKYFHITFLTSLPSKHKNYVIFQISNLVDKLLIIDSKYSNNVVNKIFHQLVGRIYSLFTGLKFSNYIIGKVDYSPKNINLATDINNYDCVFYEYWHAVDSTEIFHTKNIPCILDTHNILWQSYQKQLNLKKFIPPIINKNILRKYKTFEENAWDQFDGIIAINSEEFNYIKNQLSSQKKIFSLPMGTDLSKWPHLYNPIKPQRIVFYGGLGSIHNQISAMDGYQFIMPKIWEKFPDVEYWIVGSNPPEKIKSIPTVDPRVRVTGFLDDPQTLLSTMSLMICPWSGTYGFRSRLIEIMALGVPIITNVEAIYGMELDENKGILLADDYDEFAEISIELLSKPQNLLKQSVLARNQIEEKFSFESTYLDFSYELFQFVNERKQKDNGNV